MLAPVVLCEMPCFSADADRIFTPDELAELLWSLANNPWSGVRIRGAGGVRKLRESISLKNKGKRGGARIVYYWHGGTSPILLLAVYEKGEKIDLSKDEKRELKILVGDYVKASRL